jgi:D-tyrosyl-tRNA(Tyr) deacylase
MKAVIQRVSRAQVTVGGERVGVIAAGLVILLGVEKMDTPGDAAYLADRIAGLRVFGDDRGKMNRSIIDTGGAALVVSQFTLCGDCRSGRRPSFDAAAPAAEAASLYDVFVAELRTKSILVATGVFQAHMSVELVNDGPVTFVLESKEKQDRG